MTFSQTLIDFLTFLGYIENMIESRMLFLNLIACITSVIALLTWEYLGLVSIALVVYSLMPENRRYKNEYDRETKKTYEAFKQRRRG